MTDIKQIKTVIVTGATGYVGTFVTRYLLSLGTYRVLSLVRSPHPVFSGEMGYEEYPITDLDGLVSFLARSHGDGEIGIIHCAALANPGSCEQDPTAAISSNVKLTERITAFASSLRAYLVMLSTDLVFEGIENVPESGLDESVAPSPHSVYAKSKVSAEAVVLGRGKEGIEAGSCILRLALVYGPRLPHRASFLQWLEDRALAREKVPLFEDEWRTPIFVEDVARVVSWCLQERPRGILHCGGPNRVTRVEFALAMLPQYSRLFAPISRLSVASSPPRPRDVSLDSSMLYRLCGLNFRKLVLDGARHFPE